ncbi:HEAT repeat domain-containing protein [Alkalihalophilus marmarensis]|nr:HEAT repeat domain-containing protein [Alkalihalophilus marmarensis]
MRKQKRKEHLRFTVDKAVSTYLFNDSISLNHPLKEEGLTRHLKGQSIITYELLEESLETYQKLIDHEETRDKVVLLAEHYLSDYYKHQLLNGRWSKRMNTLYYIEDFKMNSLADTIWMLFQTRLKWDEEKEQIIRTLAALQDVRLFELLVEEQPDWSVGLYKEIFRRMDRDQFKYNVSELDSFEHPVGNAMLDVAREERDEALLPLFEELLSSHSLEVRIRALKGILTLERITNVELLTPFASSSEWVERMLFARIAGKLKQSRYIAILTELMGDSIWWVRQGAAEALFHYRDGVFILEHIYTNHPDPFARDMARQWVGSRESVSDGGC